MDSYSSRRFPFYILCLFYSQTWGIFDFPFYWKSPKVPLLAAAVELCVMCIIIDFQTIHMSIGLSLYGCRYKLYTHTAAAAFVCKRPSLFFEGLGSPEDFGFHATAAGKSSAEYLLDEWNQSCVCVLQIPIYVSKAIGLLPRWNKRKSAAGGAFLKWNNNNNILTYCIYVKRTTKRLMMTMPNRPI